MDRLRSGHGLTGRAVRLLAALLRLPGRREAVRQPRQRGLHAGGDAAVRRRRAHGRGADLAVFDLPARHRHPVPPVRITPCARTTAPLRQPARRGHRPGRQGQALGPPGAQRQPLPPAGTPARRPPAAGCATVADGRFPLHDPRLQADDERGSHRRRRGPDPARRVDGAAGVDVVHAALGVAAQPRLRCGRPDQLVRAVHQPRPGLADGRSQPALRRRPRDPRPDRRLRHHPGPAPGRPAAVEGKRRRRSRGALLLDQVLPRALRAVADGISDRRPDAAGAAVQRTLPADHGRARARPERHEVGRHRQPRARDAERQEQDGRRDAGRRQEAAGLDGGGQRHRHRQQPGQPVPPARHLLDAGQVRGRPGDRQRHLARPGFPAQRRRLHAPAGACWPACR